MLPNICMYIAHSTPNDTYDRDLHIILWNIEYMIAWFVANAFLYVMHMYLYYSVILFVLILSHIFSYQIFIAFLIKII